VAAAEVASDLLLFLLDPAPDAITASRIAWIMYYLLSGPLRQEIGICSVLVMMVDHPAIGELQENLFWKMNGFVRNGRADFLKPYLQFLLRGINETEPSDILAYVTTSIGVNDLTGIATTEDNQVSFLALKILGALLRRGLVPSSVYLKNEESMRILQGMIENAPIRCRLEALRIFAALAPDVSPQTAHSLLDPPLIRTYTDIAIVAVPWLLHELLGMILVLLAKIEPLPELYHSAVHELMQASFVPLLHEALDDADPQENAVIALASVLEEKIGLAQNLSADQ
jgi:hypothetical protein